MTLEDVAECTRIAPQYLQAIEAEEFSLLPGGVYSSSYIRQYARAIGFNEAALLDRYYALKAEEPTPMIKLQRGRRRRTGLGGAMEHLLGHLSARPRFHHPVN